MFRDTFTVVAVPSVDAAVQGPPPVIIVIDVSDLRQAQQQREVLAHRWPGVPTVVTTTAVIPSDLGHLADFGAVAVVPKPFAPGSLRAAVARAMSRAG